MFLKSIDPLRRIRELSQELRRAREERDHACWRNEQLEQENERLEEERRRLRGEIRRLRKELETAQRAARRQAAPFSRGKPQTRPKRPQTLVDTNYFRGTFYRAANWVHVGQTCERGRMDREHQRHGQAIKDIHVHPLARDARLRLCGNPTQQGAWR